MRVLLYYPRGHAWRPGTDIGRLAACLPPLGLASIAAVLRRGGHEVRIIDAALRPSVPNEQWARQIVLWRPDLLGISAITPAFIDAYDVCRRVKEQLPQTRTVFGGVHVSWGRERILAGYPTIDCVVAGEGERPMAALALGTAPGDIPGVVYRDAGAVRTARPQSRQDMCDMDELPLPAYDLLEGFPRQYALPLFSYPRAPGAHVISSRGCVYQCTYCDRSVYGRTFRWNSPEYTLEQVKLLRRDHGVRHVHFYDDLFTLNRERVARLCELLAGARLGLTFNCIVRIGHIDPELIAMLKRAGCWMVSVGIEAGDQHMLDVHKEGLSLEAVRRDVELLYRSGLHVKGLFMLGMPGQTVKSMHDTIDFACSLPLKDANATAFTPYPGSPIAQNIEQLGEVDADWSKMDCEQVVFVPREIGSREAIVEAYARFYRRFYGRPFARTMYRRMLLESPHSYWRLLKALPSYLGYLRRLGR
jgi:anaerobic magnesium-protoporphyrin IX monomethyl ester cyclase